jgi:DNA-binding transcriptional regulator YhcF (GntR family)
MGDKNKGFIKLYRSMLDWEWYDDPNTFRVFVHLLLKANHEGRKYHGIQIERGQVLTSYEKLAKECHISVRSVRTALKHLKSTGEVTSKATSSATLVTIANYGFYQSGNVKATSKTTSELTSERQGSDKRASTNKKYKELKETKEYARVRAGGGNPYFALLESGVFDDDEK